MIQLLDDQFLSDVLRSGEPPRPSADMYTTGYWYVRLCRVVLGAAKGSGVLSTPFASLPFDLRRSAMRALFALPEEVGLVSLRHLAPQIGQLRTRHTLNALGMEALAAAVYLEADVYLSAPAPRLQAALHAEGRHVEVAA